MCCEHTLEYPCESHGPTSVDWFPPPDLGVRVSLYLLHCVLQASQPVHVYLTVGVLGLKARTSVPGILIP